MKCFRSGKTSHHAAVCREVSPVDINKYVSRGDLFVMALTKQQATLEGPSELTAGM